MPLLPGTSSAQSVALGASTQTTALVEDQIYRMAATGNCWVKFGSNPTAVAAAADNHYMAAGDSLFVQLTGLGTAPKIAVIQDAASTGYLNVSLAGDD